MIKADQIMEITSLKNDGHSIRDIARITGLARNTIRKVLRGQHDLKMKPIPRNSALDPFKPYLKERFDAYGLSAVRLIEEIRPMGFTGSVVTVRRYLRTLRRSRSKIAKLTVRFETPPGKQAQADWAYCGKHPGPDGRLIPAYLFVMVLAYSRMLFVRFTDSMRMPTLFECHREAFEFFGGTCSEIVYDNMKQVRVGPNRINEQFADFALHHGFAVRTHQPYRPRTKGKVERPVAYVKDNFLAGRSFEGFDDLNAQGRHWMEHTANARIHATTKCKPTQLFETEKDHLIPFSSMAPFRIIDPIKRIVTAESMVRVGGSSYSVPPAHVGEHVTVSATGGEIVIIAKDAIIAQHRKAEHTGQCIVQSEHIAEVWKITNERVPKPDGAPRWHLTFDQSVATTPLTTFEEVCA